MPEGRFYACEVLTVKKKAWKFETVPLSEVLQKLGEDRAGEIVETVTTNEKPYVFTGEEGRSKASDLETRTVKRIFVVDDDQCIARTLTTIFRNAGYEATALYDGQSALLALEFVVPDLVISDVLMPGMTGIELAIQIKQRHPGCKILLFSGSAASAGLLEQARRQGHDFELLAKPVHPEEFLARMVA
jgi:CheY-like chemotaxis protein